MAPIRVALIEDEAPFAHAIATLLDLTPGFQWVASYTTIAEMTAKILHDRPQVALVDLELPDGKGEDAIQRLREHSPLTKSVVLSKFQDTPRIFDAIQAGAWGYVLKTDGGREILDAIQAVHEGLAAMSPTIARRALELLRVQPRPEAFQPAALTTREREVLELAVQGWGTKRMADHLGLSCHTVSNYLTEVYKKLHVTKRSELPGYKGKHDSH